LGFVAELGDDGNSATTAWSDGRRQRQATEATKDAAALRARCAELERQLTVERELTERQRELTERQRELTAPTHEAAAGEGRVELEDPQVRPRVQV
jgi:hypothetical protein